MKRKSEAMWRPSGRVAVLEIGRFNRRALMLGFTLDAGFCRRGIKNENLRRSLVEILRVTANVLEGQRVEESLVLLHAVEEPTNS